MCVFPFQREGGNMERQKGEERKGGEKAGLIRTNTSSPETRTRIK